MAELWAEVVGWVGAILILAAYYLISSRRLHGRSKSYHMMNLAGGVSVALNAYVNAAYPSTGLNTVWSAIAIYGLVKSFKSHEPSRN
jgi:cell division protein FtsW (lipid II flippase)